MTNQEEQEYQDRIGSPEMEYLQYLSEHPEIQEEIEKSKSS